LLIKHIKYLFILFKEADMIKVKYRGQSLSDPEVSNIRDEVSQIKRNIKGLTCSKHMSTDSLIHLRYTRQNQSMEKYIRACCYDFENVIKGKLQSVCKLEGKM
jgi:hypothetical protein